MALRFVTLGLQAGVIYMIFYGLTTSIQELGLKSATQNGIFLGVTQTIGYFISLPLAYKMERKRWSIIFQSISLVAALLLAYLSGIQKESDFNGLLQTIISTCVMATVNSAQFPIFFAYVSEIYPTRMRGLANALILFTGKLIGATSPFMESLSLDYGVHVLVGCSAFLLLSLPLSFLIKETLILKKGDRKVSTGSETVVSLERRPINANPEDEDHDAYAVAPQ